MNNLLSIFIFSVLLPFNSFGQNTSGFKDQFDLADSIVSSYYGSECLGSIMKLDSNHSFYLHNDKLTWEQSVEINKELNFTPNFFIFSYDLFPPSFHGDTLTVSFMTDMNGKFADQYFYYSSLVKFDYRNILTEEEMLEKVLKKQKKGNQLKEIKLSWSRFEYHRVFSNDHKNREEKIIWLVTSITPQKEKEEIAYDAYSGKKLWKIISSDNLR